MKVFVFQSGKDQSVTAFTGQPDGGNLPAEFAPWKLVSGGELQTTAAGGVARGVGAVQDAIARDGFHIVRGMLQVNRRTRAAP
jgi:hypothetical protein